MVSFSQILIYGGIAYLGYRFYTAYKETKAELRPPPENFENDYGDLLNQPAYPVRQ